MPARSEKQRRFLYATKGKDWVEKHHFDKVQPMAARAAGCGGKKKGGKK